MAARRGAAAGPSTPPVQVPRPDAGGTAHTSSASTPYLTHLSSSAGLTLWSNALAHASPLYLRVGHGGQVCRARHVRSLGHHRNGVDRNNRAWFPGRGLRALTAGPRPGPRQHPGGGLKNFTHAAQHLRKVLGTRFVHHHPHHVCDEQDEREKRNETSAHQPQRHGRRRHLGKEQEIPPNKQKAPCWNRGQNEWRQQKSPRTSHEVGSLPPATYGFRRATDDVPLIVACFVNYRRGGVCWGMGGARGGGAAEPCHRPGPTAGLHRAAGQISHGKAGSPVVYQMKGSRPPSTAPTSLSWSARGPSLATSKHGANDKIHWADRDWLRTSAEQGNPPAARPRAVVKVAA